MTRTDAEALSAKLREGRIGHEVKSVFMFGKESCSVRADLDPHSYEMGAGAARAHAKTVIDLMTGEGDWCFVGEGGRCYVSRY